MKKNFIIIVCVLAFIPCLTQCKGRSDTQLEEPSASATFAAFAQHFSSSTAFATATVGGREVLLTAQEVFGEGEDLEAVEATVFALDSAGRIVSLGSVRSQGSNYPVSLLDGRLMVAGHQFVYAYDLRGEMPELVLDKCFQGDGPELDAAFDTFAMAKPIIFQRERYTTARN